MDAQARSHGIEKSGKLFPATAPPLASFVQPVMENTPCSIEVTTQAGEVVRHPEIGRMAPDVSNDMFQKMLRRQNAPMLPEPLAELSKPSSEALSGRLPGQKAFGRDIGFADEMRESKKVKASGSVNPCQVDSQDPERDQAGLPG